MLLQTNCWKVGMAGYAWMVAKIWQWYFSIISTTFALFFGFHRSTTATLTPISVIYSWWKKRCTQLFYITSWCRLEIIWGYTINIKFIFIALILRFRGVVAAIIIRHRQRKISSIAPIVVNILRVNACTQQFCNINMSNKSVSHLLHGMRSRKMNLKILRVLCLLYNIMRVVWNIFELRKMSWCMIVNTKSVLMRARVVCVRVCVALCYN